MTTTAVRPPTRQSPPVKTTHRAERLWKASPLTMIGLIFGVLLSLFPFYWMIVIASRTNDAANSWPPPFLPGGKLGRKHAEMRFGPTDMRFTVGKDGALYAIVLAVPAPGTRLLVRSLNAKDARLGKPVTKVTLLGHDGPIDWQQTPEGLAITSPPAMPFETAVTFRIE